MTIIVEKEQFAKSRHHMGATLCGRMPKFKDLGKETSEPWPLQPHHIDMSEVREEKFSASHQEGSNYKWG